MALSAIIARASEAVWLAMLALIPVVYGPQSSLLFIDLPKVSVLRGGAVVLVCLWALRWALASRYEGSITPPDLLSRLRKWPRASFGNFVIAAAAAFLAIAIMSTLLSPAPTISIWGSNPGRDGYNLYTLASYFALFAVIASGTRTPAQLWRGVTAITIGASAAGLLSILDHVGLVPFVEVSPGRVAGPFGNPLFAGAFFASALPLTAAAGIAQIHKSYSHGRIALWGALAGLQASALLMSLSRGPWLAAIAGIAALALLVWFLAGARTLGRAAILTAIAAVIAVASLQLPVMPPREGELLQNGSEASDPEGLIGRASGIGDELSRGGVSGRLSIWSRTATLIVQRPWFDPEQKGNIALRHLFGYGPEMFLYAFPTIENLDSEKQVNASPHNYLLLITAELGIAGLLAFAAMMVAATLGAGKLIAKGRRHVDTPLLIVVAGLGCVLIVRAVEQMTGVARVSDTALFWASLGLLVAAARMAQTKPLDAIEQHAVDWPSPITARVLRWGIASLVVAIAVVLLVPKNVSYVRAASLAASAYATLRTGDGLSAIETMARASAAAPDTDYYYLAQSDILGLFEAPNDEIALEIAKERHRLSAAALAANPLSHQALSYLATATGRLFDLGQRERGPEAIALFEEINRRIFTNQIFYQGLAIAHVKMGQPERAVEALDEVERLLDGHVLILPDLYYIRGVAYQDMGRTEDAIRELDRYVSDHEQITYRLYALDRLLALVDADEHPGEIERYEELRGKTLVLLEQQ